MTTAEARGAATTTLRGAARAALRAAATAEAPGAALAALRGVEVVASGAKVAVLVWTLVDQQTVNKEGFVGWRCGGSWCGERRRKQTANGAKWRRCTMEKNREDEQCKRKHNEVRERRRGSQVCGKNITSVIFPTDLIFKTISFF